MAAGPGTLLAIAAGGALGALGRFGVSHFAMRLLGPNFPYGTLFANVAGSFLMGLCVQWFLAKGASGAGLSEPIRAFVTIGLLGAFTTFSTFSLDAVSLWRDRSELVAITYVSASLVLSIAGLLVGLFVGRSFT